jgi:hypothetical protein
MSTGYWPCTALPLLPGCRSWEIKNLQLEDIRIADTRIRIRREIAKNAKNVNRALWRLQNGVCANSSIGLGCWAQQTPIIIFCR